METAKVIASKSPVAIYTMRQVFQREMLRRIGDGLEYIARFNASSLSTNDTSIAIGSFFTKEKPIFPKL